MATAKGRFESLVSGRIVLVLVTVGLTAWGCINLTARTGKERTPFMEVARVRMSASEMRTRVNDLIAPLVFGVESAADRIRAQTDDPLARRRALLWKLQVVPAVHRAAFQTDPLAALIDVWLLLYQEEDYFSTGAGSTAFGEHQPVAVEASRQLLRDYEAYWTRLADDPERYEQTRRTVRDVAASYPLVEGFSNRYTALTEIADRVIGGPKSAFSIVGEVSETVTDVANRANIYLEDTTKLARWHAELLAEDLASRYEVESTLQSVRNSLKGVDRAMALADPERLDALTETGARLLQQQKEALMRDVDAQRVATLDHFTSERRAVLEVIGAERLATMADLRRERLETMTELETLRKRTLEDGVVLARELIDHAVWRLGQLLAVLAAVGGSVTLLVALALGRRHRTEGQSA